MSKNFYLAAIIFSLINLTWTSEAMGKPWFRYSPVLFLGSGYETNPGLLPASLREGSPYYQVRPEMNLALITGNGLLFNLNYNYVFNDQQRKVEAPLPVRTDTITGDYSFHHLSLGLSQNMGDNLTLSLLGEIESERFSDASPYNNWQYLVSPRLQYTFNRKNTSLKSAYVVGQRRYPDRVFDGIALSTAEDTSRQDQRERMPPRRMPPQRMPRRHQPMHPMQAMQLEMPDQDDPVSISLLTRAEKQRDQEQGIYLTLGQRFSRTTEAEMTYYFHTNSSNSPFFDYYDHNIFLDLSQGWGEKLDLNLSWQYQYRPYQDWETGPGLVKRKDQMFKLSLEIKYRMIRGVELVAGYSYAKNNSRDPDQSYLDHLVYGGIRFYLDLWKM